LTSDRTSTASPTKALHARDEGVASGGPKGNELKKQIEAGKYVIACMRAVL
jgi:hypothetical protein